MTTYPLSELATIHAEDDAGKDTVMGRGTLSDCADIVEGFTPEQRGSARIEMDSMDLRFDAAQVDELLQFLRSESAGLSDKEISAIGDPDS